MRGVWVDSRNDPDWAKLRRHGITWVFVSLDDPPADVRRRLLEIRARGLVAGVYSAWSWFPGKDGAKFAEAVHSQLQQVVPDASATWPRVQLNDETHDPVRIEVMLRRWRQLRPATATSWTLEGMQGGWATHPPLVQAVLDTKVRVVPQAYAGNMDPWDTAAVLRDLTERPSRYPDRIVSLIHDAAALRRFWDGWAFTQGRLP